MDELQQQRLVIMNLIARAKATIIDEKGSDVEMSDEENVSYCPPPPGLVRLYLKLGHNIMVVMVIACQTRSQ